MVIGSERFGRYSIAPRNGATGASGTRSEIQRFNSSSGLTPSPSRRNILRRT